MTIDRPPAWTRPPPRLEAAWYRIARAEVAWLRGEIVRSIRMVRGDAEGDPSPRSRALGALRAVRQKLDAREPTTAAELADLGRRVYGRGNVAGQRLTLAAGGRRTAVSVAQEAIQIARWARDGSDLIRTLLPDAIDRLEGVITTRYTEGARVETIARQLQDQIGVTERHARVLARDQVGKLNSRGMIDSAKASGASRYQWLTSEDEAVRESHAAVHLQIFSYDDPPLGTGPYGEAANPGEAIQCRCIALPQFDATDQIGEVPIPLDYSRPRVEVPGPTYGEPGENSPYAAREGPGGRFLGGRGSVAP